MRNVAIAMVVLALAAVGIVAAVTWEPPAADCAALLRQAEHTSDAGALVEEASCEEPLSPARQRAVDSAGTVPR